MAKKNTTNQMNRREFVKRTSLAAASFTIIPSWVMGGKGRIAPSDKITLGYIGLGRKGLGLGKTFSKLEDAQIVAGCDVDQTKLNRFQKEVGKIYSQGSAKQSLAGIDGYGDFREIINRDDIDAIVIATPDHWHAIPAIMAMKAGKDVYGEKPMCHTIKEGRAMVKAARKNKRIFQTGSQQRSGSQFLKACELVRNGYIGELKKVYASLGEPSYAVACDLEGQPVPKHLNWDMWLGPAPEVPFHDNLAPAIPETFWPKWRYYKEFATGMLGDWGAHMYDIAQWGMGMDDSGPVELIPPTDPNATQGLVLKYANGVELIQDDFGRGRAAKFVGTEGTIIVSRQFIESDPANIVKKEIGGNDMRLYKSENHYQNWLDCIRSRELPICDVEIGHRSASVCILSNIAYQLRRPLKWNPKKEKFVGDKEANALRSKDYRGEWSL